MPKQRINIGTAVNTGTGDTLRSAMQKVNNNFDELYDLIGQDSTGKSIDISGNVISSTFTNTDINISPNGTGDTVIDSDLVVNTIKSDDSSEVTVNDGLNVNGTVTATAFVGDGSGLTGVAGGSVTASSTDTFTNKTFDANGTGNSISNIDIADFTSGVFLDEDNMASDSATSIASQQSIKAYVDAEDANIASDSMTFTNKSGNISQWTNDSNYATQAYVDARDIGDLSVVGSTISAPSNADLTLTTSGTGSVSIDGIQISGTEISSSDSTQVTIKENLHVTGNITGTLTASGNDTEVQFNNSGAFAGDSGLTFDSSGGKTLKVGAGGGTVKANSFQGADSVSTGVTFQSDNGSGVKANHLQIQSHTGSVQTVFPSGAVDFTSAGSVDFTGTTVTGLALTMVGDDSSGTAVNTGETFKIAGATGVTTAVSGDTLTITGPDLTSYVTASSSTTFTNKTFDVEGTGNSISNIDVADLKSGVLDTDLSSVSGSDDTLASAKAIKAYVDSEISGVSGGSTGDLTITGSTISSPSNADLTLTTSGTGSVSVDAIQIKGTSISSTDSTQININENVSIDGTLTVSGSTLSGTLNTAGNTGTGSVALASESLQVTGTTNEINVEAASFALSLSLADDISGITSVTASSFLANDAIKIIDNKITGTRSNENVELEANGTGGVIAQSPFTFNAGYIEKINTLTSSSTITVDCSAASIHTVTLGTSTEFNISNLPTGGTVTLIITQDGTGNRTATFGTDSSTAVKFQGAVSTLSTIGGRIDVVTIVNDGTNFLGNIAKNYA
jgi:hypothetical protein